MLTRAVFLLLTCVCKLLSLNDVRSIQNFPVEWIDFNILTCAVPTRMNVSLFSCIASDHTQIDASSCLPSTTIDFQPDKCSLIPRTTTYSSPAINVRDHYSSTQVRSSTVQTIISNTNQMLISSSARTTRTLTATAVSRDVTTQSLSATSNTNRYFSTMLIRSTTQMSAARPARTTPISVSTTAVITATISTAASTAKRSTVLSSLTTGSVTGTEQTSVTASTPATHSSVIVTTTETLMIATDISTSPTTTSSYYCSEDNIGPFCNISSDACAMSQPCLNAATCYPNNTLPLGYRCQCQSGYTGNDCENDERICKENTCWHNGRCMAINSSISDDQGRTFYCECRNGHTGTYCELTIDLCRNITCANRGICQTINAVWKCICLAPSLFYGDYCQFQTNSLLVKRALSRSFASIAITIIVLTCAFVVLMDILKYAFDIDPVKVERRRYWKRHKQEKRAVKSSTPKIALRFQYIP